MQQRIWYTDIYRWIVLWYIKYAWVTYDPADRGESIKAAVRPARRRFMRRITYKFCAWCGFKGTAEVKLKKCKQCHENMGSTWYCNVRCQSRDWGRHRLYCER